MSQIDPKRPSRPGRDHERQRLEFEANLTSCLHIPSQGLYGKLLPTYEQDTVPHDRKVTFSMTAQTNSRGRYASKSRTYHRVSIGTTRQRKPEIIIASIQRRQAAVGPNTHTDQFEKFLATAGMRCQVLTPFSNFKLVAYPVLAARRLIDLVSKPVGVWWLLRLRRLFLRLCISHALQPDQTAVIYANCPNSAWAALDARKNSKCT